jgi:hypothetical protein
MTFRPPGVLIRFKNPWVLFRFNLLGWKVLFMARFLYPRSPAKIGELFFGRFARKIREKT